MPVDQRFGAILDCDRSPVRVDAAEFLRESGKHSQKAILLFVSDFHLINLLRWLLNHRNVNHVPAMLKSDFFGHHPSRRAFMQYPGTIHNTMTNLPDAKFPDDQQSARISGQVDGPNDGHTHRRRPRRLQITIRCAGRRVISSTREAVIGEVLKFPAAQRQREHMEPASYMPVCVVHRCDVAKTPAVAVAISTPQGSQFSSMSPLSTPSSSRRDPIWRRS